MICDGVFAPQRVMWIGCSPSPLTHCGLHCIGVKVLDPSFPNSRIRLSLSFGQFTRPLVSLLCPRFRISAPSTVPPFFLEFLPHGLVSFLSVCVSKVDFAFNHRKPSFSRVSRSFFFIPSPSPGCFTFVCNNFFSSCPFFALRFSSENCCVPFSIPLPDRYSSSGAPGKSLSPGRFRTFANRP